jgi:cobalamin biosynthesis protein CobD/CbiB
LNQPRNLKRRTAACSNIKPALANRPTATDSHGMILTLALLLDAALGEPKLIWDRIPHPAVLMGRLVAKLERRFNRGTDLRLKGTGVAIALVVIGLGPAG